MKTAERPGFSPRRFTLQVLAFAACAGMAGWWWLDNNGSSLAEVTPSGLPHEPAGAASRSLSGGSAPETAPVPLPGAPREIVAAWMEKVWALEGAHTAPSVITLSIHASPEREAAFQRLLASLTQENAPALHDLLTESAAADGTVMTDAEWKALLKKWGRLDGAGAAAHLLNHPDLAARAPALLRGWASIDPPAAAAWLEEREREIPGGGSGDNDSDHSFASGGEGAEEPPLPWRAAARRELLLGWLQVDFDAPAHWLNEQRHETDMTEAVAAFAKEAAAFDPEGALVWAHSLQGPWRQWAVQEVGTRWLAQNSQEAQAALQQADYSAEAIAQLAAPPPEGVDLLLSPQAPGVITITPPDPAAE